MRLSNKRITNYLITNIMILNVSFFNKKIEVCDIRTFINDDQGELIQEIARHIHNNSDLMPFVKAFKYSDMLKVYINVSEAINDFLQFALDCEALREEGV